MEQTPSGYQAPSALLAALSDRARSAAARHPEVTPAQLQTEFVHRRFLARVFHRDSGDRWVLKGGVALLARVADARHSRDIDLHNQIGDLDAAIDSLRDLCAVNLGDHFRFAIARIIRRPPTAEQPHIAGAQISIAVSCGTKTLSNLRLDIVVGSVVTAAPDRHAPAARLALPGLHDPEYLLYPVVDHIADKVCATAAGYGAGGAPSSRPRDLVDLVVLARTHPIDGDALARAIAAERHHRGQPPLRQLTIPSSWAGSYPTQAVRTPECDDHRTLEAASQLMRVFIDPVLDGTAAGRRWNPHRLSWSPRHPDNPTDRWATVVAAVDPRLIHGADWSALATTLDKAAAAGADIAALLPELTAEPLPDRRPATELKYRLLASLGSPDAPERAAHRSTRPGRPLDPPPTAGPDRLRGPSR